MTPAFVSSKYPFNISLQFSLKPAPRCRRFFPARAHGMWTYEPREGRKAATAVCSASAVVTLAPLNLRLAIGDLIRSSR